MLVLQEFLTKRLDLTGLDWTSKEMSGIIMHKDPYLVMDRRYFPIISK